jgi:phosphomannomutase
MSHHKKRVLALFDIDGTLSPARQSASPEMMALLEKLRKEIFIGIFYFFFFFLSFSFVPYAYSGVVGGSDLVKQQEQLRHDVLSRFDYNFPENGIVAFKQGREIHSNSLVGYLGEERYKHLVNFILRYISDLDIPVKRGTFIELRTGLMNVSPIGRNCSATERAEYEKFDLQHGIRSKFVEALQNKFADYKVDSSCDLVIALCFVELQQRKEDENRRGGDSFSKLIETQLGR